MLFWESEFPSNDCSLAWHTTLTYTIESYARIFDAFRLQWVCLFSQNFLFLIQFFFFSIRCARNDVEVFGPLRFWYACTRARSRTLLKKEKRRNAKVIQQHCMECISKLVSAQMVNKIIITKGSGPERRTYASAYTFYIPTTIHPVRPAVHSSLSNPPFAPTFRTHTHTRPPIGSYCQYIGIGPKENCAAEATVNNFPHIENSLHVRIRMDAVRSRCSTVFQLQTICILHTHTQHTHTLTLKQWTNGRNCTTGPRAKKKT